MTPAVSAELAEYVASPNTVAYSLSKYVLSFDRVIGTLRLAVNAEGIRTEDPEAHPRS